MTKFCHHCSPTLQHQNDNTSELCSVHVPQAITITITVRPSLSLCAINYNYNYSETFTWPLCQKFTITITSIVRPSLPLLSLCATKLQLQLQLQQKICSAHVPHKLQSQYYAVTVRPIAKYFEYQIPPILLVV
jgi:hypothetical protein